MTIMGSQASREQMFVDGGDPHPLTSPTPDPTPDPPNKPYSKTLPPSEAPTTENPPVPHPHKTSSGPPIGNPSSISQISKLKDQSKDQQTQKGQDFKVDIPIEHPVLRSFQSECRAWAVDSPYKWMTWPYSVDEKNHEERVPVDFIRKREDLKFDEMKFDDSKLDELRLTHHNANQGLSTGVVEVETTEVFHGDPNPQSLNSESVNSESINIESISGEVKPEPLKALKELKPYISADVELEGLAAKLLKEMDFAHRSSGPMQVEFPEWYMDRLPSTDHILRENSVESLSTGNRSNELVPCVFNWTHGGHTVYLTGSFNNWSVDENIRMSRSGHEFTCIQELPIGLYYYKFIVDDQWRFAPNQPTHTDERGNVNNVLDLTGYHFYNFTVPKDHEQARDAAYHQFVPGSNDYTTDAPVIPILLSKSNCVAMEPPTRIAAPLHSLSNHLYHDSQAANLFGPDITSVSSTQRWRHTHKSPLSTAGLRFSTLTYVTFNPLFPCHGDPAFELHAATPLRSLLEPRRTEEFRSDGAAEYSEVTEQPTPNTCLQTQETGYAKEVQVIPPSVSSVSSK